MNASDAHAIPIQYERLELKYIIPELMIEPICEFIAPYCAMDPNSMRSDDHFYPICSLYFDTPSFLFWERRVVNVEDRFNLRLRYYDQNPSSPVFVEVKRKKNNVVIKRRARIVDHAMLARLYDPALDYSIWFSKREYENFFYFINLLVSHNAEPKVLVKYWRRAYVSTINDYARITFDRRIRYQVKYDVDIRADDTRFLNLDSPNPFGFDGSIILELKCNTEIPVWFADLVQRFDLRRTGFSKYATTMLNIFQDRSDARWFSLNSNLIHSLF